MPSPLIDAAAELAGSDLSDAELRERIADGSEAASLALEMREADRAPHVGDEADHGGNGEARSCGIRPVW